MKTLLILLLALPILSCSSKGNTISDLSKTEDEIPTKSAKIELEILSILPIGWGFYYGCKIISAPSQFPIASDSTFRFSVSVGSKEFDPTLGKATLTFERTGTFAEDTYIPNGTTGTRDQNGEIWNLIGLSQKTN